MTRRKESQPIHTSHVVGDLTPQTPFSASPRSGSPVPVPSPHASVSPWLRWAVIPMESLKLIVIPLVLYVNWEAVAQSVSLGMPNPFGHFFLISGFMEDSPKDDPRYRKTYYDILFVTYYIVVFCFLRQIITSVLSPRIARYFGLRKPAKLQRFGEQAYAFAYFSVMGVWGYRVMSQQPTFWFQTKHFWINYPFWDIKPELKAYYLIQAAHWYQQLIVMLLGLEKPRKDYLQYVAHHAVTVWLIVWSYLVNMTPFGNAVYLSMDIPDALFAFSKILNYIQYNRTKTISFFIFFISWTYFRHYLNILILGSVLTDFDTLLRPETMQWNPPLGVWLIWWMQWQMFIPLLILQFLNLYWYSLIIRVLIRALTNTELGDDRSDDEDGGKEKEE